MSNYARTGGILTIISGAWSIFYVIMYAFYALMPQLMKSVVINTPSAKNQPDFPSEFFLIFTIMGALMGFFSALVGALAITGGVFALKRKHWAVAIAGAIAGALLLFPCGIAGTVLVSLGRPEFLAGSSAASLEESQQ